jgi:HEAT repeat protein
VSIELESESLVNALSSGVDAECERALLSITKNPDGQVSEQILTVMIGCLGADSKTIRRRAADALAAVTRGNPSLLPSIRAALMSADPRIRFGAAYALGAMDGDALTADAAPALTEALGDSDGDVRWAAAELIVRLGQNHAEKICRALLDLVRSGNAAGRKMGLYCIRNLEARGAVILDAAARCIRDDDLHVRLAAIALLSASFSNNETALGLIQDRLEADREAGVRRAAAIALGAMSFNSQETLAALERASSQTADHSLARAARASLDRLKRR